MRCWDGSKKVCRCVQWEPLALVGKVYAWMSRRPRNAARRARRYRHYIREFSMGGADADGGCCTLKRGSGIFILVLSIISLVGSIICALIASWTEMGLYAAFNWIHFVLLIYLIRSPV